MTQWLFEEKVTWWNPNCWLGFISLGYILMSGIFFGHTVDVSLALLSYYHTGFQRDYTNLCSHQQKHENSICSISFPTLGIVHFNLSMSQSLSLSPPRPPPSISESFTQFIWSSSVFWSWPPPCSFLVCCISALRSFFCTLYSLMLGLGFEIYISLTCLPICCLLDSLIRGTSKRLDFGSTYSCPFTYRGQPCLQTPDAFSTAQHTASWSAV